MKTISDKKLHFSMRQIEIMISNLAAQIKKSKKQINVIVGIESGGLYISKPLSKILNIPHSSIKISFYGDKKTPSNLPIVDEKGLTWNKNDHVLFVDDLIDSGSTFNYIPSVIKHKNYSTAVLFHKKDNKFKIEPTFYVKEKPEAWLVFPWN